MQNKPFRILFTRSVSDSLIRYGQDLDLEIISKDFIKIEYRTPECEELALLQNEDYQNWVFTSKNAVKSLLFHKDHLPLDTNRTCFAVGRQTAELVLKLGYTAQIPLQYNAKALTKLLEKENTHGAFLYFCGNIRRNTLINFFNDKKISFRELVVYHTLLVQPELNIENFDAVCFCSPSAVKSFFSRYNPGSEIPCFAIGNTTASTLEKKRNKVIISEESSLYALINTCYKYLNNNI